jgi:lipopolysaccharide/colanic/teichoic acid biosynthesis glycosyltransferase/glycosyltransferase involved in cell wall biosynthesis
MVGCARQMQEPVAIVHDWLTSMRGGERVVEVLCKVFPQADLFTLTWDPARLSPALAQRRVTTSPLHRLAQAPFANGGFRAFLPLFPLAVESFNLNRYALVVSSSHCVAMGAIAPPSALHIAYVHSTLRYAREAQATYEASVPGGPLGLALFRGTAQYLRRWESAAAARPDVLIANSTYTRDRIRRYYSRDAVVIAPPIDTDRFASAAHASRVMQGDAEPPYLLVSALVPNKRVDLALRAFQGRPERLIVVGEGPERARIEPLIGPNVTLLSRVDEAQLTALFAGCRALLHTGVDDFGMVMVEALAAGRPVIACAEGGALDIVRDGETGLLIAQPTVAAVRAALDRFARRTQPFDSASLQTFARSFGHANFERSFAHAVEKARREKREAHINGGNGARSANGTKVHSGPPTNGTSFHISVSAAATTPAPERAHPHAPDPSGQRHVGSRLVANHLAKRLLDATFATSGLIFTAPLLGVLGTLIRLDSPGPALFRQHRIGLHDCAFTMVKLRTMDTQGRVTRVGRLLRPTGLDELPQLWNVLKGHMSIIGPRPEVPERVRRFEVEFPGYGQRHAVRPGITGWAQVSGLRGNVSIAKRLEFDVRYVREWSLILDGHILLRTFSAVWSDTVRELGARGNGECGPRST